MPNIIKRLSEFTNRDYSFFARILIYNREMVLSANEMKQMYSISYDPKTNSLYVECDTNGMYLQVYNVRNLVHITGNLISFYRPGITECNAEDKKMRSLYKRGLITLDELEKSGFGHVLKGFDMFKEESLPDTKYFDKTKRGDLMYQLLIEKERYIKYGNITT